MCEHRAVVGPLRSVDLGTLGLHQRLPAELEALDLVRLELRREEGRHAHRRQLALLERLVAQCDAKVQRNRRRVQEEADAQLKAKLGHMGSAGQRATAPTHPGLRTLFCFSGGDEYVPDKDWISRRWQGEGKVVRSDPKTTGQPPLKAARTAGEEELDS